MKNYFTDTAFGKMLNLSSGNITIGITTKYGLRISHISAFDLANICFFDEKFTQTTTIGKTKWLQLGGHRLWKSPEDDDCYIYDNNTKTEYVLTDNGANLVTETRGDGLIFRMNIEFITESSLRIIHSLVNQSVSQKNIALWGITALNHNGKILLPLNTCKKGFLPNRNIVFWPYTDICDKRLAYTNNGIEVSPKKNSKPLKIGVCNNGKIIYANNELIFTKQIICDGGAFYPDMGCNIECYTDAAVLEMETLSPLYEVQPSGKAIHTEIWSFEKKQKNTFTKEI